MDEANIPVVILSPELGPGRIWESPRETLADCDTYFDLESCRPTLIATALIIPVQKEHKWYIPALLEHFKESE